MRRCLYGIFLLMCAFVFTGTAGAGDVTPQKVVDLTYAAVQSMVDKGEDQTFQIINDPKGEFVDGELYAFVYDMAGTILAHPNSKLIGKALIKIKDVKGKAFVAEFISIAKSDKGEGWSDYWWPKLGEKNASQKVTFIKRVPGMERLVGVGAYDISREEAENATGIK